MLNRLLCGLPISNIKNDFELEVVFDQKKCVKLWAWQAISSPSRQVQKTARNTANHQRHPSLSLCLWPSLSLVLSAIPHTLRIPTAPCGNEGHIAFWEKLSAKIPSGHGPTPTTPPKILPGLLQIVPGPPGHHTTQNNRTHQHFHLHPRASSDTAAAAVRPLTGTDRVLKSRYSWHTPFPLQWYEHRRSQTWMRVPR